MGNAIEQIQKQLIHLSAKKSPNRSVMIETNDDDRFIVQIKDITDALKITNKVKVNDERIKYLLKKIFKWGSAQTEIQKAFITYRDLCLRLIIIKEEAHLDEELLDSLAELDIEIANDPELEQFPFDSLALPCEINDEIETFLNPDLTFSLEI